MTSVYRPRDIAPSIIAALSNMPVVVVTGMRQTGKSTFLQRQPEFKGRRFVSLDDFSALAAARSDPDAFVAGDEPITIDEAQRCPELFVAIKRAVDRKRTPGRVLLSGSANFLLMKGMAESLAGRAVYFRMHPFTRREATGKTGTVPFIRRFFDAPSIGTTSEVRPISLDEVLLGGMPPVRLGGLGNPALWFKGYEQTYLERDIRDLGRVGDLVAFRNLLRLTALRTGQILCQSELGRDAKLSASTVGNHLSLLEVSCVLYRVPPYLRSPVSRLVKSPKAYIGDSGLAGFFAGAADLADHPMKGALVETFVAQNLFGTIDAAWPGAEIFYWNVQGRHEVDFIIEEKGRRIAVEVKASARWDASDLKGLRAFVESDLGCVAGILAYNGSTPVRAGERIWAIPLSLLLS